MSAVAKFETPSLDLPPTPEETEAKLVQAWKNRRAWNRTDTTRWLNERSAPLLAWLRRRSEHAPAHSRMMGEWLKRHELAIFDRVHARMLALPDDDARARLMLDDALRS